MNVETAPEKLGAADRARLGAVDAREPPRQARDLFRGLLIAGLRRHGAIVTVLVSSLLFALLHGSIYRLPPTFFLGVALAWVRLATGSIAPGMIVHALNNGIAAALMFCGSSGRQRATRSDRRGGGGSRAVRRGDGFTAAAGGDALTPIEALFLAALLW
jgi:hypothetical protein